MKNKPKKFYKVDISKAKNISDIKAILMSIGIGISKDNKAFKELKEKGFIIDETTRPKTLSKTRPS